MNRKMRRIRFSALIILLIALSVFSIKFIGKNKSDDRAEIPEKISKGKVMYNENIIKPAKENKNLGNIESIIEYETNGLIGAHYPVFGKKNIDKISKDRVNKYIDDFKSKSAEISNNDKDYKYELSVDYETYNAPADIVSVSYNILENSIYMAHPDEKMVTRIYDLSGDKEIKLDDILDGEYLKFLSDKSEKYFKDNEEYKDSIDTEQFKEGIAPRAENYSNFIFKEDKLVIIFEKYTLFSGSMGSTSVEISYLDLKDYLKPDRFEAFTKEKYVEKVEEEKSETADVVLPKRVVDGSKPMIALTFDDGPNKKTTVPILDALKKHNSAATFFVLGNRVSNNTDILRRMLEEGSEVGNHSYNHKELTKISSQELSEQIKNTQDAVVQTTGIEPKLLRPTFGSYNDNLKAQVEMPFILWSVDTLDWKSRNTQKVVQHVLANVKDGDIILMHDIYESTAQAAEILIPKLIDMGYQLVTVSELYESRGVTFENGHIYNQMIKE